MAIKQIQKMEKILLKENELSYNEMIKAENQKINNGKTLLANLAKLGLNLSSVENWQIVESHFLQPFPKANLTFNLHAAGIEKEYRDLEAFYLKNSYNLRFDPITEEEQETIREQHRIYANSPQQLKAHSLIHSIVDNFNELQKLGVSLNGAGIREVHRVFVYSLLDEDKFQIRPDALINIIQSIK